MIVSGFYPDEKEARAYIEKYTTQPLQPLPDDKVEKPNTVFCAIISVEGDTIKSALLMLPDSMVKEHRHPRESETYSALSRASRTSTKRVAKSETCARGGTHSLKNDSDQYAVVFSTKKGVK